MLAMPYMERFSVCTIVVRYKKKQEQLGFDAVSSTQSRSDEQEDRDQLVYGMDSCTHHNYNL